MGLERVVYHVVPDRDGGWELRKAPGELLGRFALKSQAIAAGQKRARGHDFAQLVMHHLDFTVEQEWTHLVEDEEDEARGAPDAPVGGASA